MATGMQVYTGFRPGSCSPALLWPHRGSCEGFEHLFEQCRTDPNLAAWAPSEGSTQLSACPVKDLRCPTGVTGACS